MAVTATDEFKVKVTSDNSQFVDGIKEAVIATGTLAAALAYAAANTVIFDAEYQILFATFSKASAEFRSSAMLKRMAEGFRDVSAAASQASKGVSIYKASAKFEGETLNVNAKNVTKSIPEKASSLDPSLFSGIKASAIEAASMIATKFKIASAVAGESIKSIIPIVSEIAVVTAKAFSASFLSYFNNFKANFIKAFDISTSINKLIVGFSMTEGLAEFFAIINRGSTAGAQQVGLISRAVLGVQYAFDMLKAAPAKAWQAITQGGAEVLSRLKDIGAAAAYLGLTGFGELWKSISGGIRTVINDFRSMTGIFGTVYNGFMRLEEITMKWGVSLKAIGPLLSYSVLQLTGLAVVAELVTGKIIGVGKYLFTAFDEFTPAALKADSALVALNRSVNILSGSASEDTLAMEEWTQVIDRLRKSSLLSEAELTTMAGTVTDLATTFDLNGAAQEQLLTVMAGLSHSTAEAKELTEDMSSALAGNSLAIYKYGINVNTAAINHSSYAIALGKTKDQMDASEVAQAALSAVYSQTKHRLNDLNVSEMTHAEVQERLSAVYEDFAAQLGHSNVVMEKFINSVKLQATQVMLKFAQTLKLLPINLVDLITNTVSYTGAVILGLGYITKYTIAVVALMGAYRILTTVMATNALAQGAMTAFFSTINGGIGTTFIQVTRLSDVFRNLSLTFVGIHAQAGVLLINSFKMLGTMVSELTFRVLANPLFGNALAIAAAITVVYGVLSHFREEIQAVLDAMSTWQKVTVGLIGTIVGLAAAVNTSAVAQASFIAGSKILVSIMGGQSLSIVSVSTALAGLRTGFVTMFTTMIPALWAGIMTLSRAFGALTISVITNPIFYGAATIVGAMALIIKASKELKQEIPLIGEAYSNTQKSVSAAQGRFTESIDIFKSLKKAIVDTFNAIVQATKISMIGLLQFGVGISRIYFNIRESFADDGSGGKWTAKLRDLDAIQSTLSATSEKSLAKIIKLSGGVAEAAVSMDKATAATNAFNAAQANAKSIGDALQAGNKVASLTVEVLGDEYDKAAMKAKEASAALYDSVKNYNVDSEAAEDARKKIVENYNEYVRSTLEVDKMRRDSLKAMTQEATKYRIEELKHSGQAIAAIKMETAAQLAAFNAKVTQQRVLGSLSPEQEKTAHAVRRSITGSGQAAIQQELDRQAAADLQEQLRVKEKIAGMDKIVDAARLSELKHSGQLVEAAVAEGKVRIDTFNKETAAISGLAIVAKARATLEREITRSVIEARRQEHQEIAVLTQDSVLSVSLGLQNNLAALQRFFLAGKLGWAEYVSAAKSALSDAAHATIMAKSSEQQKPVDNAIAENTVTVKAPMLAAADKVVGAIQGLIDFLPNFINKVATVFQSIRDFPLNMGDAIANMFNSFLSMFQNFNANSNKMTDKIFDSATRFLDKLPDVIANLVAGMPDVIQHIIAKLPKFFAAMLSGFIKILPTFWTAVISVIVQGIPAIIHTFVHMLEHELPQAFKEALIATFNELKAMINGLFSGAKFHLPDFSQHLARVAQQLKGSASQIFNIADFKTAAKNVDIGDRVRDAVNGSVLNLAKMLGDAWRYLVANWKWIATNLLFPFIDQIRYVWQWVYDKVLTPIFGIVQAAWQWVYDKVLLPIYGIVQAAWQWVYDKVLSPISAVVQAAFQWVITNVLAPIAGVVSSAFQWVVVNIIGPMSSLGQSVFKWVKDHVVDPLLSFAIPAFHWPEFPVFQWPQLPDLTLKLPAGWSSGGPVGKVHGAVQNIVNGGAGIVHGAVSAVQNIGDSLNLASGGQVRGGVLYAATGTEVQGTDSIRAMLTPGEYVLNRHASSRIGTANLDRMNSGMVPGGGTTVNASITVNTTQPIDANFIRSNLVPVFMEAVKSASENGRYVISKKGIRA